MGEKAPKLGSERLVIATHNDGKLKEINDLISPYGIEAVSAKKIGLNDPEETGKTFAANAILKARSAAEGANLPALADDSGLEVAALRGDPGIYSARWAGNPRDFDFAMKKVEKALEDTGSADRTARFVCVLCLAWPDGRKEVFEGKLGGRLTFPPRGNKGFGYDPIFVPEGYNETFGEMDPAKKHAMSHRAIAFRKLIKAIFE